jgi:exopolyphosphatase/pppGpp-phosphohydrolase
MKEYYIDLGSSTIKVYEYESSLKLIEEHSIYFKNNFTPEKGISDANKEELYHFFESLKGKYDMHYENTHIFATGIFRNLIQPQKQELVRTFNSKFDLHFNIISHGIENYYLGKAMENNYNDKKVMIINMGGKTTEIVTFLKDKIIDRKNLKLGVADLLNTFPNVNDRYSSASIDEMANFVKEKISDINFDNDYNCAIFTGGEERFEKLTNYHLVSNALFEDGIHKYMVSIEDFIKGNNHIFFEMSLDELYSLMPNNPKWMDGARAGAVLPQAIFEKANIKFVIPSDLNLINGIINDINE